MKCYEDAKRLFNLNTALIQTARDKAVEILKSFEKRCGHVVQVSGRELRCSKCGLIYNRFECMHKHSPCLKAWDGELGFEPADERRRKVSLNAGSFAFKGGGGSQA